MCLVDNTTAFDSVDQLWQHWINDIREYGEPLLSRDGDSRELIGMSGTLLNVDRNVVTNSVRKFSPIYAAAEFIWYLAGERHIDRVLAYAPSYARFADEKGLAHGAYGSRFRQDRAFLEATRQRDYKEGLSHIDDQISAVCRILKSKSSSRQAIITIWNGGDLAMAEGGQCKDIPCTLTIQFLLRKDELHCVVSMRSNDIWLGTPYDIWCFTSLQKLIAAQLGVRAGRYTHNVGSLHWYDRNEAKLIDALNPSVSSASIEYKPHAGKQHDIHPLLTHEVCVAEHRVRNGDFVGLIDTQKMLGQGSLLSDSLACCASKWNQDAVPLIENQIIRSMVIERLKPKE